MIRIKKKKVKKNKNKCKKNTFKQKKHQKLIFFFTIFACKRV